MALLKYLYTDHIEDHSSWDLENLMDILVCAEEYQVTRLKSICEVLISEQMKLENCLDILQLSDMHFARDLKKFTLKFIIEHITELENCGELFKLNMNLMTEIIQFRDATDREEEEKEQLVPPVIAPPTDVPVKTVSPDNAELPVDLLQVLDFPLPPWPTSDDPPEDISYEL